MDLTHPETVEHDEFHSNTVLEPYTNLYIIFNNIITSAGFPT